MCGETRKHTQFDTDVSFFFLLKYAGELKFAGKCGHCAGFSEVQLCQKMIDGITKIIQIEEMLAANPGMKPVEALKKCK